MEDTCTDLVSFADGELEPMAAQAFRNHLVSCEACQINLVDVMQLSAQLSTSSRRSPGRRRVGSLVCLVTFLVMVCLICALT